MHCFLSLMGDIDITKYSDRTPIYIPKTVDGKFCSIPFIYKGQSYHDCIKLEDDRAWCSLDEIYVKGESPWNYCVPHPNEFEGCTLATSNVTLKEVYEILREHNMVRAEKPAYRMWKMEWNSELAQKAQAAANKCVHVHVEDVLCGERYKTGQNLYYNYWDKTYPGEISWKKVINFWSREEKYFDIETLSCAKDELCEHYTQVIWAKSGQIGCGKAYCYGPMYGNVNNIQYSIQYVCNYFESGNVGGFPPYAQSKVDKCQNCWAFDTTRKFRCDKDKLCEACKNDMEQCLDLEDIKVLSKAGKICSDTSPFCDTNAHICTLKKDGMWLPPPVIELIEDCNKTCNRC